MINIALNGAKIDGAPFYGTRSLNEKLSILFFGNLTSINLSTVIGGLCVPWMLFVKPFILKKRHEGKDQHKHHLLEVEMANLNDRPREYLYFEDEVSYIFYKLV